jgi:hypothetical protein
MITRAQPESRRIERIRAAADAAIKRVQRLVGMRPVEQQAESRWNEVVPKRALNVEFTDGALTYLHPTKGRRRVNIKRLTAVPPPSPVLLKLLAAMPRARS